MDKTIPPRRKSEINSGMDVTMPGKRDRKPDGRFEPGDLILNRYKVISELGQGSGKHLFQPSGIAPVSLGYPFLYLFFVIFLIISLFLNLIYCF